MISCVLALAGSSIKSSVAHLGLLANNVTPTSTLGPPGNSVTGVCGTPPQQARCHVVKQLGNWSWQEAPDNAKIIFMTGYVYTCAVLLMPPMDVVIAMPGITPLLAAVVRALLLLVHRCRNARLLHHMSHYIQAAISFRKGAWPAIYTN